MDHYYRSAFLLDDWKEFDIASDPGPHVFLPFILFYFILF